MLDSAVDGGRRGPGDAQSGSNSLGSVVGALFGSALGGPADAGSVTLSGPAFAGPADARSGSSSLGSVVGALFGSALDGPADAESATLRGLAIGGPADVPLGMAIGDVVGISRSARSAWAESSPAASPTGSLPTQPCASRSSSMTGTVVIDVEGKVAHPGVQTLPAGSRVYEALAAAGGALPGVDATGLDLARPVADGEQLRVGIAGEPSPAVGVAGPSAGVRGKRKGGRVVNLNTATLDELEGVPDVGPAMAQRILDWRAAHGRFASVGQLREVRGIGERKFAEMRDSVTVGP
ncbi:MAG: ComEA family DNA-binding protein [Catenulispora sp.]|nr:ComEA family DNA-binding protein [Catenulispora sp.]